MSNKILRVKLYVSQSGNCEDIFRSLDDKSRYYSRSISGRWGTATKWAGGFERSEDLSEDIEVRVYSSQDYFLFSEDAHAVSNENYPFTWNIGESIKNDIISKYQLVSHENWRDWLLEKRNGLRRSCELAKGYTDNWLYVYQENHQFNTLDTIEYYGRKYQVIEEKCTHSVAQVTWKEYYLKSSDIDDKQIIYGYKIAS